MNDCCNQKNLKVYGTGPKKRIGEVGENKIQYLKCTVCDKRYKAINHRFIMEEL